jgi:FdhE protein
MTKANAPQRDTTVIGELANPAFVRLPDPLDLFATRAARFRFLAGHSDLKSYLEFLAGLCEVQHQVQGGLPAVTPPDGALLKRARDFGMPPLGRDPFEMDLVFAATLEALLRMMARIPMPDAAAEALSRLQDHPDAVRSDMARAVLADSTPAEALPEHIYVAAALQIHFARLAAGLDAKAVVPVGDGACPVCGSPPASSMVVGWQGAHGTRYCACALCGTLWNYVRVKCTLCASTEGIAYQEIEGSGGVAKAETCNSCHRYVKILHQHIDPAVEVIADDVASLGLDLLVRETTEFRRGGVNPFLLGY